MREESFPSEWRIITYERPNWFQRVILRKKAKLIRVEYVCEELNEKDKLADFQLIKDLLERQAK